MTDPIRTRTFEYDPEQPHVDILEDAKRARHTSLDDVKECVGEWYLNERSRDDSSVLAAYDEIARVNREKFDHMLEEGLTVVMTDEDPYRTYWDMKPDIRHRDTMKVFSGGSVPPHLTRTENTIGRAVHDRYGHYEVDRGFDFYGEFRKWDHVRDDYGTTAQRLLFTEVIGQLCAANVLDKGFESPHFRQKAIVAPDCVIDAVREHVEANDPEGGTL
jgi:hypothetical protein